jgi:hypothetical protein
MISRDELYRLVWSQPMTKVAEQFNPSGSYLARICTQLAQIQILVTNGTISDVRSPPIPIAIPL